MVPEILELSQYFCLKTNSEITNQQSQKLDIESVTENL